MLLRICQLLITQSLSDDKILDITKKKGMFNLKNCVSINLKKDEILIKLSDEATQEEIVENLKKKLPELKKLYKEEKTPITVTGKVLKNKEIDEIQEMIKEKIDVEINFDIPKTLGLHSIKKTYEKEIGISETKFHRGSLRSRSTNRN